MITKAQVTAVRDGGLSFDVFARETRKDWERMANALYRRWRMPTWVTVDDVVQDLLFSAWQHIIDPEFDPTRSTLQRYVTWNSTDKAKKRIHKLRGAKLHGNADRSNSTIERPSDLALADAFEDAASADVATAKRFAAALTVDANQDEVAIDIERVEQIFDRCMNERERLAFRAVLTTGDIKEAALLLYADARIRLEWRLNSEDHATRIVKKNLSTAVGRVALHN